MYSHFEYKPVYFMFLSVSSVMLQCHAAKKKKKKTLEELQYNKLCCWSIASSLGSRSRPHTVDDIMAWSADHDCTLL